MNRRHFHLLVLGLLATVFTQSISGFRQSALAVTSRFQANKLIEEAQTHLNAQEWKLAIAKLEAALAFFEKEGLKLSIAMTQIHLAKAYIGNQNFGQAQTTIQKSVTWFLERQQILLGSTALMILGLAYEKQAQILPAIATYERSVEFTDRTIAGIRVQTLQEGPRMLLDKAHYRLIDLYHQRQDFKKMLEHIERSKARAFLDQLAHGSIDFGEGNRRSILVGLYEIESKLEQLDRERQDLRLQADISEEEQQRVQPRLEEIEQEIQQLAEEYKFRFEDLKAQSPKIADLHQVTISNLQEIQASLGADTTLVNYFVGIHQLFAVVVTSTDLKAIAIPTPLRQLAKTIKAMSQEMKNSISSHPKLLQDLDAILIAPLRQHLKTPNIGIIPHGLLHYVPFAALTDGRRYLCDDYAIFMLPSASVLRLLPKPSEKQRTGKLLLMGNPTIENRNLSRLEASEAEVEAIAAQWNSNAYTGKQATETRFWQDAPTAEIIHLAAHGQFNSQQPLWSTIHLAPFVGQDGNLHVHELYRLNLEAARLVVLSACETKVEQFSNEQEAQTVGDEIVGLNRSFLFAGAPTVLATLRVVGDRLTKELMLVFYDRLKQGNPKAQALRQAMLTLKEKNEPPYKWGIYILTGDWREL
ncbi:CHAT domain-containing protein [Roseofilum capinflatum]|uniref:CHAT domain-containing protein n=1 Tax=Roseofilum capinflatum BLCC-M114 TaxID=3022440 RepID=A0ABT7B340_9CYAN|nr:CHAT domain-containing protein [Roseofilum capinflatum]MDJ1173059.1 CHAT domain-containing protein [Roseofilum capinflatum BLCC-M114]